MTGDRRGSSGSVQASVTSWADRWVACRLATAPGTAWSAPPGECRDNGSELVGADGDSNDSSTTSNMQLRIMRKSAEKSTENTQLNRQLSWIQCLSGTWVKMLVQRPATEHLLQSVIWSRFDCYQVHIRANGQEARRRHHGWTTLLHGLS